MVISNFEQALKFSGGGEEVESGRDVGLTELRLSVPRRQSSVLIHGTEHRDSNSDRRPRHHWVKITAFTRLVVRQLRDVIRPVNMVMRTFA
jgi:hypothetical protein